MNIVKQTIPFISFLLVLFLLWRGLDLQPSKVPSPLINKTVPSFNLPSLSNPKQLTSEKDFLGHVTMLNVWASWCYACALEHTFLLELAKMPNLLIYGFNYKDDAASANEWLKQNGNPYQTIAMDQRGKVAIDLGVYGAPETYLIDKKGVIRYKHIGPVTSLVWQNTLKPIFEKLQDEQV